MICCKFYCITCGSNKCCNKCDNEDCKLRCERDNENCGLATHKEKIKINTLEE